MIFVTVGTHEQQFNRLIKYMDNLKGNYKIDDEVVIQIGFCTYTPKYCRWSRLFSYDEMLKNIQEARIVITHGGPASFIMPLQYGKIPIVVPRQKQYGEHVNNHQVDFCCEVEKRRKNIIGVLNINKLERLILDYENIIQNRNSKNDSNNFLFCNKLEKVIEELLQV